jgi:hypothetical protein
MSVYAHIKRCLELADRDIASAVADRRLAKALLDQLAKVSRPGDGAPKLLLVFAKLASESVEWIDGALRVEMVGDSDVTVVEVLSELGLGMHERVFPSFKMGVPLEEFARAVERVPHMIAPLKVASASGRRLVLAAALDEEEDEAAAPVPAVSIGDDSLYGEEEPKTRSGKEKAAAKEHGVRLQPRTISSAPMRAGRKSSKADLQSLKPRVATPRTGKTLRPAAPVAEAPARKARTGPPPLPPAPPPPSEPAPKVAARAPEALPKPPALPRTEERTPAHGSPQSRSVVAKVPLTRIQVPRGSPVAAVEKRSSKHPKRQSMKPPKASKPPERRSKAPPPTRSSPPRSTRARTHVMSEPPDEEAIDTGWDDPKE